MTGPVRGPYSRAEIEERFADPSVIAGARPVVLVDGASEGVRVVEVRTGSGFRFEVLLSRGMDVGQAEYQGIPISWRSPTAEVAPAYYDSQDSGWLRSFHGGLLVGCGLRNVGDASVYGKEPLGVHGRLSNLPAERWSVTEGWHDDQYAIKVRGSVREASAEGESVLLTRTISTHLGQSGFELVDRIFNRSFEPTPLMVLYHLNLGFPIVSEQSRFVGQSLSAELQGSGDAAPLEDYSEFGAPTDGRSGRAFYHRLLPDEQGRIRCGIVRDRPRPLGFEIEFSAAELPYLTQWIVTRRGTYYVALEPGNCHVGGLAAERRAGRLQMLGGREERTFHLRCSVLTSDEEIASLTEASQRVLASAQTDH